jgi:hypothetical protein
MDDQHKPGPISPHTADGNSRTIGQSELSSNAALVNPRPQANDA